MAAHRLTVGEARQIAVQAQLLSLPRPTDLHRVVEHLTLLQIDPTAVIAPSADLVLWSRLGSSYRPEQLTHAVEEERRLFERVALIRPTADLRLYRAEMAAWPTYEWTRAWLEANDAFRRDVLRLLADSGPLLSRDVPDTSVVPWESTGWTGNRNVTQMLECLAMRGEVAIAGRKGRQRLWDLAERVYGDATEVVPEDEALRVRDERRLRALGIARAAGPSQGPEPGVVGEAGEPVEVEGVSGTWRVDPEAVGRPFTGRTALLSPFDRLVHDRRRALELFDFEYTLEMYKPKEQRRWGYFALPILHHERLVGKLDATADRKAGRLVVHAIHEDVPFTRAIVKDVRAEIADLAAWLGLTVG